MIVRMKLLVGISVAAMIAGAAAGTASAQNTSVGNCTADDEISPGGTCDVEQIGTNNFSDIFQSGEDNYTGLLQDGIDNSSTVDQVGESNYSEVRQIDSDNISVIDQDGDENGVYLVQEGEDNESDIDQEGSYNYAEAYQEGDDNVVEIDQESAGDDSDGNTVYVEQEGDDHVGRIDQDGEAQFGAIGQFAGDDHNATINQTGVFNYAVIAQGEDDNYYGGSLPSFNNSATVNQNGANLFTVIGQGADADYYSETAGSNNVATVNSNPINGSSEGNGAVVLQQDNGNIAAVNLFEGGENDIAWSEIVDLFGGSLNTGALESGDVLGNFSYSEQENSIYFQTGSNYSTEGGDNSDPMTANSLDVSIRGVQNRSFVFQNGVLNSATVSILGGGTGLSDATGANGEPIESGRIAGNSSTIYQAGIRNRAAVSIGGLGGRANRSVISQTNVVGGSGTSGEPGTGGRSAGHTAFVFQRGTIDDVSINQNANSGTVTTGTSTSGTVNQSGSWANVSTLSLNSNVYLEQNGTNSATISLGLDADGLGDNNFSEVIQNDAGDELTSSTGDDPIFGGSSTSVVGRQNQASVSQAGSNNGITIEQNAVNSRAVAWQRRGTDDNDIDIQQGTGEAIAFLSGRGLTSSSTTTGTGATGINMFANVTQGNASGNSQGNTAIVAQDGRDLTANILQIGIDGEDDGANQARIAQTGRRNNGTIDQSGVDLFATIEQLGTSSSAANPHVVTITQRGEDNDARGTQASTVTRSAAGSPAAGVAGNSAFPGAHAGGARSAEIVIMQEASGNRADVYQQGAGQRAWITQTGDDNVAAIQQEVGATNAVAVINQSGDNNNYLINQTLPGQYLYVNQTGNNNSSSGTFIIRSGAGGPGSEGGTATAGGAAPPTGL
jgi:hypothetical protein